MRNNIDYSIKVNYKKHVWEGWLVKDFINELELMGFDMIMRGRGLTKPFKNYKELKEWVKYNQPYYKKHIPDVYKYFKIKYDRYLAMYDDY